MPVLQVELATAAGGQPSGQAQADPGARRGGRLGAPLEERRPEVRSDPGALVVHADEHAGPGPAYVDLDRRTRCVPGRVAQQDVEDLADVTDVVVVAQHLLRTAGPGHALPAQAGGGHRAVDHRSERQLVTGRVGRRGRDVEVGRGGGQSVRQQGVDPVEVARPQLLEPGAGRLLEGVTVLLQQALAEQQARERGAQLVQGVLVLVEPALGLVHLGAGPDQLAVREPVHDASVLPGHQEHQQRDQHQPLGRGGERAPGPAQQHRGHEETQDPDGDQRGTHRHVFTPGCPPPPGRRRVLVQVWSVLAVAHVGLPSCPQVGHRRGTAS
nr:hypothetical protein [Nocardioides dokdonensis]